MEASAANEETERMKEKELVKEKARTRKHTVNTIHRNKTTLSLSYKKKLD